MPASGSRRARGQAPTGNPAGRIWQHKNHAFPNSFTARHKVERLVWYEVHETAISAIQREKRIKDWQRE